MYSPLMSLVQHDDSVGSEISVNQTLPQQHTLRHVLDLCLVARTVFKTNRVTNLEE